MSVISWYQFRRILPDGDLSGQRRRVAVWVPDAGEGWPFDEVRPTVERKDCEWMADRFGVDMDSLLFDYPDGPWLESRGLPAGTLSVHGDGRELGVMEPEPVPDEIDLFDGCPTCGHVGNFFRGDLLCPSHGSFGGIR